MTRPLHTGMQIRALEADLAHRGGLSSALLMQRAGEALFRCVRANWTEARRILVIVGPGNNGGDGYVLARLLRERPGIDVVLLALAEARAGLARDAAQAWTLSGGVIRRWMQDEPLPPADLIVDALFGIGLSRDLDSVAAGLVGAINDHGAAVLAVDVPSGIDADTGRMHGIAVRATRTVCVLARKRGLYSGAAVEHVGALSFDALGIDATGVDVAGSAGGSERNRGSDALAIAATDGQRRCDGPPADLLLERGDLHRLLPVRRRGAHKGDNGHVLVIGGDTGMAGATRMAGHAALRAGAGRVSVATRSAHADMVGIGRPELMIHGIEDATALAPLLARADVVAIGPGLGQGDWGRTALDAVLACGRPLVLDADALNMIARSPRTLGGDVVLTPHPGEAARLLDSTIERIEGDRYAAVRALAQRYGCVVVLKGAGTLVDDGERCHVCPYGNPGMASGGMGDALTGIIAALAGQGLALADAAVAGVLAHALAGDAAARDGERGLLAGDLIEQLRGIVNP